MHYNYEACADQLAEAMKEVFLEMGLNVNVHIPVEEDGAMKIEISPIDCKLTQEIVDFVLEKQRR